MATFMDDRAVAERVLEHIRNGTTDLAEGLWREPVANYRSQARLHAEIALLRRSPAPFCPSAALGEAGAFVAREAAGTPLVAVRDEEGRVRVFRNACRHRGMPLAQGAGCAKAFVCRYHGWTYRLDGRLRHIPDEHGFPGLDKDLHGLVGVAAEEKLGLVWVTQQEAPRDADPYEGLSELIGSDQRVLDARDDEFPVNWKIFLEGFLEGYHIRSAHRETFYPYGFDNLNLVESRGRNSRVTFPFRRIEKLADVAPADRRVKGLVTYVYHLFPNVLVTVLSHHTALVVLEPVSVDRTRLVTYSLADCGDDPAALEAAKRDAAFVNETGAQEDREIICAIQHSLDSGANEVFTFGRFEGAIQHLHRNLTAALEEGQPGAKRGRESVSP
jgi:phenylpropionate dioxygenase-like ring-hydroxylating dioxygenase large terminal subunit